jgi:exodeoxyribonuclease VII large subunit
MSPLKVLSRGYALPYNQDGTVIRSVQDVSVGGKARVLLSDGSMDITIDAITEESL